MTIVLTVFDRSDDLIIRELCHLVVRARYHGASAMIASSAKLLKL